MIYSLTWLSAVLENAGLKVAPVAGWESRGRGDVGTTVGVICHHTAGPRTGNMPSLRTLVEGRSDLAGPLSQLGIGRDGTFYVIAAGRANHAGAGVWKGFTNGNANFIGIEAENSGTADEAWPDIQMDAYRRGVAAILSHLNRPSDFCAGHKEYALPLGRKPDPTFDMDRFRSSVAAIMGGTVPLPNLIPAAEPATLPGATPGRPTLRRGDTGEFVKRLQQLCQLPVVDGFFGPKTEAGVREFQRSHSLVPDGIVGPKTWAALDVA